jgi:hypothetical protein
MMRLVRRARTMHSSMYSTGARAQTSGLVADHRRLPLPEVDQPDDQQLGGYRQDPAHGTVWRGANCAVCRSLTV